MPEYVTREEFEARVGVLESEVDGEKLVTRHVLEQTRRNGDDLAAIKTRLDRVERKVDGLGSDVNEVRADLGSLKTAFQNLVRELPVIVGQVMREVMGDRGRS